MLTLPLHPDPSEKHIWYIFGRLAMLNKAVNTQYWERYWGFTDVAGHRHHTLVGIEKVFSEEGNAEAYCFIVGPWKLIISTKI